MFGMMSNQDDDQQMSLGEVLAGRIMSAEFNLAVQQPGNRWQQQQAQQTLAVMLGQWLSSRYSR